MKRFLSLILAAALLALLFTSCSLQKKPKTADELYARIDTAMDALDSYKAHGTISMTFFTQGVKMNATSESRISEAGLVNGDYYFYSETETVVKAETIGVEETVHSVEAFYHGNAYLKNEGDGLSQRFSSAMTAEEYMAYQSEKSGGIDDGSLTDCVTKVMKENEDGTYSIEYSGYTARAVETLTKNMGLDDLLAEDEIVDYMITVCADEEMRVSEIKMNAVFDIEEETQKPSLTVTYHYSDYDGVNREPALFTEADYNVISDIRLLDKLETLYEEMLAKKENTFWLISEQHFELMGEESSYLEKDIVTYGEDEQGFFYAVDAMISEVTIEIDYKNGTQTIRQGADTETAAQTDAEARAYITGLMSVIGFQKLQVREIVEMGDGVYAAVMDGVDEAAYRELVQGMGMAFSSCEQKISFSVDPQNPDVMTEISTTVTVACKYHAYGLTYNGTLTLRSTIDLDLAE